MLLARYNEEITLELAATTLTYARQYSAQLAKFGINETMLNKFEQQINEANALPREITNRTQLKDQTRSKKEVLENCFQWGRHLRIRLEMAFGKKSDASKNFPTRELRRGKTNEMVMLGIFEMLQGLAEKHATALSECGQTSEILMEGKALSQQLRQANESQELKKKEKLVATKTRRQKFAALQNTIKRIQKAGQTVFEKDPAVLVLFKNPRVTPKEPEDESPANGTPEAQPN